MEVGVFQALVNKLHEKQLLDDSRISVEEKVAIFLYALAKNASNETLQYEFQHSGVVILEQCLMQLHSLHVYIYAHLPYTRTRFCEDQNSTPSFRYEQMHNLIFKFQKITQTT